MKSILTLLLLILVQSAYSNTYVRKPSPSFQEFREWMKMNEKAYTNEELNAKFRVFIDNHNEVENLNEFYFGMTEFKLNKFADLTPNEFKSKILMNRKINSYDFKHTKTPDRYLPKLKNEPKLPDSFDWRDGGAVTPVKDQGSVGACWAFSAAQNVEGQYKLKGNPLTNLSMEQIIDCDGTVDVKDKHADCGVYGGWPFLAFEYLIEAGGMASEKDYSFCAGIDKNPCEPCEAPGYNKTLCGPPIPFCKLADSCQAKLDKTKFVKNLTVVDWKRLSENETEIALQLMNVGPLSIAMNAETLSFYHKGIFDPTFCDPTALDHAILLVGWGIENKKPFWIIKNSWGTKWGENGYFRLARGKGKCGVNTQVVTAILA